MIIQIPTTDYKEPPGPAQSLDLLRTTREWMRQSALPSMRDFAEEQIWIPDGPFEGERFNCERQPFAREWFGAVDSGLWQRFMFGGPNQLGKSLLGSVIPVLYHLFGIGESVIFGVPSRDYITDKWNDDLLPAIMASPALRRHLPTRGSGSRGGSIRSEVRFRNGATLRFMTGGGRDSARAGKSSRVLVITEVDSMDESSSTSRESDKISQLEARTLAHRRNRRVYLEGTFTIKDARLDREYRGGTQSRLAMPCPHCGAYVTLGRDHLVGWREAKDKLEAGARSRWVCPDCGVMWTESERRGAARSQVLVHRGQTVTKDGKARGKLPRTDTMAFRVSAPDNFFWDAGDVGQDEWASARDPDEENAERRMVQQIWGMPYRPPGEDHRKLSVRGIQARIANHGRGSVPAETMCLTLGVDLGKFLIHWFLTATFDDGTPHAVDYGRIEVATDDLGVEPALRVALAQLRDMCAEGWDGRSPDQIWIDSNWQTDVAHAFVKESGASYRAIQGQGAGQQKQNRTYRKQNKRSATVRHIGQEYHIVRLKERRTDLVHINADFWKGYVHERLLTPLGEVGAMTLFAAPDVEHLALAKHLTAEARTEEFIPDKGLVTVFRALRSTNHWLDCAYIAAAAAHYAGARLEGSGEGINAPQGGTWTSSEEGRAWLAQRRQR